MDSPAVQFLASAWSVFGIVGVSVAATLGLAFLVFRHFSSKWLDAKFGERLENYRHIQNREIESFKFRINSLIDRASKIHGKEFEYLPLVWADLNEAYRSSLCLVGGLRQYPSLDMATPEELQAFADNSDMSDWHKKKFFEASDKRKYWIKLQDRKEFFKAINDYQNFKFNLSKYSIFFSYDIKSSLEMFSDKIWSAAIEFEIYDLDAMRDIPIVRTARNDLRMNGANDLKILESLIRDRLFDAETVVL